MGRGERELTLPKGRPHPAAQELWVLACWAVWFLKEGLEVYVELPSFKTLVNKF